VYEEVISTHSPEIYCSAQANPHAPSGIPLIVPVTTVGAACAELDEKTEKKRVKNTPANE
jgi:hypothetical protein